MRQEAEAKEHLAVIDGVAQDPQVLPEERCGVPEQQGEQDRRQKIRAQIAMAERNEEADRETVKERVSERRRQPEHARKRQECRITWALRQRELIVRAEPVKSRETARHFDEQPIVVPRGREQTERRVDEGEDVSRRQNGAIENRTSFAMCGRMVGTALF